MNPFSLARGVVVGLFLLGAVASRAAEVDVRWLGGSAPALAGGVSWGVPWAKGAMSKEQRFALRTKDGAALPLQSWPLAYWADGSVKWSGFATVAGPQATAMTLTTVAGAEELKNGVTVRESAAAIEVETGRLKVRIARQGERLVESMAIEGREVAREGRLIAIVQDGPERSYFP
ncbi:MAG: hypothetical protein V4773_22925 [Verrucomicrobiota bacterium]